MSGRLRGKVAMVIGVGGFGMSPGNGRACALLFAREGAQVFAVDADAHVAAEVVTLVRGVDPQANVAAWGATLSDPPQVAQMVGGCAQVFGRVDIVVIDAANLAGREAAPSVQSPAPQPHATGDETVDAMMRWSRDLLARTRGEAEAAAVASKESSAAEASIESTLEEVLWLMRRGRGGSILIIPAVEWLQGGAGLGIGYAPSKAWLQSTVCRITRADGRRRIRANGVLPGVTTIPAVLDLLGEEEEVLAEAAEGASAVQPQRHHRHARHLPLGRWNEPWDVAFAALFLVSDEARHVTGQVLAVDGGLGCLG